jgi:hypothetical protein
MGGLSHDTVRGRRRQGDHDILVILNEAVGKQIKPWWRFW